MTLLNPSIARESHPSAPKVKPVSAMVDANGRPTHQAHAIRAHDATKGPEAFTVSILSVKAHPGLAGFSSIHEFGGKKYRAYSTYATLAADADGTLNHEFRVISVDDEAAYDKGGHAKFEGSEILKKKAELAAQ
jgi:hypothetical protein